MSLNTGAMYQTMAELDLLEEFDWLETAGQRMVVDCGSGALQLSLVLQKAVDPLRGAVYVPPQKISSGGCQSL